MNKNQSINETFDHGTWDFYNLTIPSQNVYSLGADMYVDHHSNSPSSNLNMQHCFAYFTYIWYVSTCMICWKKIMDICSMLVLKPTPFVYFTSNCRLSDILSKSPVRTIRKMIFSAYNVKRQIWLSTFKTIRLRSKQGNDFASET